MGFLLCYSILLCIPFVFSLYNNIIKNTLYIYNNELTNNANRFLKNIKDDFIVYGVTQDCKIFFVERNNINLFNKLKIDFMNTYCYPNQIKLHLQQGIHQLSFILFIRQTHNRICLLNIEMPHLDVISSERIFSYSLYSSLPYATCSHLKHQSFILNPNLSFMDTTFSDIVYFVNEKSAGNIWDVQQFQIISDGYLKPMNKFSIYHNRTKEESHHFLQAKHYIFHLDLNNSLLYSMNRHVKNLLSECAFDLLFRPSVAHTNFIEFDKETKRQMTLESFSVDDDLMLYIESNRVNDLYFASIYGVNLSESKSTTRLFDTNFVANINVLKKNTIKELLLRKLPKFDEVRIPKKYSLKGDNTSADEINPGIVQSSLVNTTLNYNSKGQLLSIVDEIETKLIKPTIKSKNDKNFVVQSNSDKDNVDDNSEIFNTYSLPKNINPTNPMDLMIKSNISGKIKQNIDETDNHLLLHHDNSEIEEEEVERMGNLINHKTNEKVSEEPFWKSIESSEIIPSEDDDERRIDDGKIVFHLPQRIFDNKNYSKEIASINLSKPIIVKNEKASVASNAFISIYFMIMIISSIIIDYCV